MITSKYNTSTAGVSSSCYASRERDHWGWIHKHVADTQQHTQIMSLFQFLPKYNKILKKNTTGTSKSKTKEILSLSLTHKHTHTGKDADIHTYTIRTHTLTPPTLPLRYCQRNLPPLCYQSSLSLSFFPPHRLPSPPCIQTHISMPEEPQQDLGTLAGPLRSQYWS